MNLRENTKSTGIWWLVAIVAIILAALTVGLAADESSAVEGTCGSNTTWTFENGTLTISGSGSTNSWSTVSAVPWYSYKSSIKTVVVEDGVSYLGQYAFQGCSALTSVSLPDSLRVLSANAFCNCTSLETIVLPDSIATLGGSMFTGCTSLQNVTLCDKDVSLGAHMFDGCIALKSLTIPSSIKGDLGEYAFANCTSLASITIPDAITSIKYNAFSGCSALTSIKIGDNVRSIGDYAFEGCPITTIEIAKGVTSIGSSVFSSCENLSSITVNSANTTFASKNGILFDKALTTMISYPEGKGTTCNVPSGTTTIAGGAFEGSKVQKIVLPSSVTTISDNAFTECSYLSSVTMPSVQTIGDNAFSGCTSLTTVSLPTVLTSIGAKAFSGSGLTSVTVPDNVSKLGEAAFKDCKSLTTAKVGNKVLSIEKDTFNGCSALTTVNLGSRVTELKGYAFNACTSLQTVTFSSNLTAIGAQTFYGCSSLVSLTIPDTVYSISMMAFINCDHLQTVNIPASLKTLSTKIFSGCSALKSISISGKVTSIGAQAFENCTSLATVTMQDSVTSIGSSAFKGCTALKKVVVSANLANVNSNSFDGTSLYAKVSTKTTLLEVTPGNLAGNTFTGSAGKLYATIQDGSLASDGVLNYRIVSVADKQASVTGFRTASDTLVIPATTTLYGVSMSVVGIYDNAFSGASLVSATFPESIASVGTGAFSGTEFYDGGTLLAVTAKNLAGNTFTGSDGKLYLPDDPSDPTFTSGGIHYEITSNSDKTVMVTGCDDDVTALTIPSSATRKSVDYAVTAIADGAFSGMKFASVAISNTVTSIGTDAFKGLSFYDYGILLSHTVKNLVGKTFTGSDGKLYLPAPAAGTAFTVGEYTFAIVSSSSKTASVTGFTGTGTLEIPATAVYKNVTLKVVKIADEAFAGMDLTSVTIPASVKTIGTDAFEGLSFYDYGILLDPTAENLAGNTFTGSDGNLYLPAPEAGTAFTVGEYTFAIASSSYKTASVTGFTGTGTLEIPAKTSYKNVALNVTRIADEAFAGMDLTSVTIPAGIKIIGTDAFRGLSFYDGETLLDPTPENLAGKTFTGSDGKLYLPKPEEDTFTVSIAADPADACEFSSLTFENGTAIKVSGNTLTIGETSIVAEETEDSDNGFVPYMFESWTLADGNALPKTVTSDLSITAHYTIHLDLRSELPSYAPEDVYVHPGSTIVISDASATVDGHSFKAPSAAGYSFECWEASVETVSSAYSGDAPVSLTACYNIILKTVTEPEGLSAFSGRATAYKQNDEGSPIFLKDGGASICVGDSNTYVKAGTVEGYRFVNWTIDGAEVTYTDAGSSKLYLNGPVTAVANYVEQFTVTVSADNGGSCSGVSGPFEVDAGTKISASGAKLTVGSSTITASNSGYTFSKWVLADGSALPGTVTADIEIVAKFVKECTVTVSADNGGTCSGVSGPFTVDAGTAISASGATLTVGSSTITASNSGYTFSKWVLADGSALPKTVTADIEIVAKFVKECTVTVSAEDGGSVSGATSPFKVNAGTKISTSGATLTVGSKTLTASSSSFEFDRWTLADGSALPGTVTADIEIVAKFVKQYTVTVTADNGGTCSGVSGPFEVDAGTEISASGATLTVGDKTITASNSGYTFSKWALADGSALPGTVTADIEIVAKFVQKFTVTISAESIGSYSKVTSPFKVNPGTKVSSSGDALTVGSRTFTAYSAGYEFDRWALADGGELPSTVTADIEIVAMFDKRFNVGGIDFSIVSLSSKTVSVTGCDASITALVIPETATYCGITYGVESIEAEAFSGMMFTTVTVPSTITSIGTDAFKGLSFYDGGTLLSPTAENLAGYTFTGSDGKLYLPLPDLGTTFTNGEYSFMIVSTMYMNASVTGFTGEDTLVIPSTATYRNLTFNVNKIASGAFSGKDLKSVTIPDSISYVGTNAFYGLSFYDGENLLEPTAENLAGNTFTGSDGKLYLPLPDIGTTFTVDGLVFSIESYSPMEVSLVGGPDGLKTLVVPETVSYNGMVFDVDSIGKQAFYGFRTLRSVDLGNVTSVGVKAFANCAYIKTIDFGESLKTISAYGFYKCKALYDADLATCAKTLRTLGSYSFYRCDSLDDFAVPSYVKTIGNNAFTMEFQDENGNVLDVNAESLKGYYYDNVDGTLVRIPGIAAGTEYASGKVVYKVIATIPAEVELNRLVGDIRNTTIPATKEFDGVTYAVVKIGDYAYKGCKTLRSVDMSSVEVIGKQAFYGCTYLKSIDISSATSIGVKAFANCGYLSKVTFGDDLKTVSAYAFYKCKSLTDADLSSVKTVGSYAFYKCSALEEIDFGDSLSKIGTKSFAPLSFLDKDGNALAQNATNLCGRVFVGTEGVLTATS